MAVSGGRLSAVNDDRPTVGELFAGIGGIGLGLERAGFRVAWHVEIDPFCQHILAERRPDVPTYGDIKRVDWSAVESVDLLAGGFPCQPVSVAGKQQARTDERWLWREFARAIRDLRPRLVLVENVRNLLAVDRGRAFGEVLGDLAALGFDAEWDCIPASAVGAPHRRDRLWLVAYPGGEQLRDEPGRGGWPGGQGPPVAGDDGANGPVADADGDGLGRVTQRDGATPEREWATSRRNDADRRADPEWRRPDASDGHVADTDATRRRVAGESDAGLGLAGARAREDPAAGRGSGPRDVADTASLGVEWDRPARLEVSRLPSREGISGRDGAGARADQWATEPDVGRVAHGVPARVDRLRALGNAVVPQVPEIIGQVLRERLR